MERPPLRALLVFEAAARHMSFQRAARELKLTPSAVSHQIHALETHLGQALFLRLNRTLRLTEAGASYYRFVRGALEQLDEGSRALKTRKPRQMLRVRTGGSFAEKWLLPRLPLFLSENPQIEFLLDTRTFDGEKPAQPDIEIRYGKIESPQFDAEPLVAETVVPLCSPALLRGPNPLREPADLAKQTLIESERSLVTWSMWLAQHHSTVIDPPRLRFDRSSLAIQAAVLGLGIALEGDFLASEELASGRLVTPFLLRDTALRTPLRYLIVTKGSRSKAAVRDFREWLFREMRR